MKETFSSILVDSKIERGVVIQVHCQVINDFFLFPYAVQLISISLDFLSRLLAAPALSSSSPAYYLTPLKFHVPYACTKAADIVENQGFMRAHHEIEKAGRGFGKVYSILISCMPSYTHRHFFW